MKYVTVTRPFLTGPALGADNAALGAWLRLMSAASENGRESECLPKYKSDRESMIAAGVTLADIEQVIAGGLAERTPDGGIKLAGFDHEGLAKVEKRRKTGRKNGLQGGRPPNEPGPSPDTTPKWPTLEEKPATSDEKGEALRRQRKEFPDVPLQGCMTEKRQAELVLQIRRERAGLRQ